MNDNTLILAIDQGGQSSRVAVYRSNGELVYCFSAACETSHTYNKEFNVEFIEQNPEEILQGIKSCLTQITNVLKDDVKKIIAVGFAGQGSSLLCWHNQTGEALTPVLSWQDIRGEQYLKTISLNPQQAQEITGLRISPHYGASKIRWCLENNPQVIAAQKNNTLSIGPIVSFIFWHLLTSAESRTKGLKQTFVDPGHAQRTLLWNLHHNQWDDYLLEVFGIAKSLLPECKAHNSYFGDLCLDETRLGKIKIPCVASARDQGASLFARGLPDKTACYINIGTGAFIQRVSTNLQAPDGILLSPLFFPENSTSEKLFCWEATVNGAASAMSFIQQQTDLTVSPEDIHFALTLNPETECYFLNAIGGLSAPYWRTDLTSYFSNNLSAHEKILAWLESVIFQIVINVTLMHTLGALQKIYISGGLSRADALCQKLADLTESSVIRSDNTDATLQGIAFMASGFSKQWQPKHREEVFYPENNPPLQLRFDMWQKKMNTWLSQKDGY